MISSWKQQNGKGVKQEPRTWQDFEEKKEIWEERER
jgi:hypothetical protein